MVTLDGGHETDANKVVLGGGSGAYLSVISGKLHSDSTIDIGFHNDSEYPFGGYAELITNSSTVQATTINVGSTDAGALRMYGVDTLKVTGDLTVGNTNAPGLMTVASGGTVSAAGLVAVGKGYGTMTLSGASADFGGTVVGDSAGTYGGNPVAGTLTITSSEVNSAGAVLGGGAGATGDVTVTGSGSYWGIRSFREAAYTEDHRIGIDEDGSLSFPTLPGGAEYYGLTVGHSGKGTLTVSSGGVFEFGKGNNGAIDTEGMIISQTEDSNRVSKVTVTGSGSKALGDADAKIIVGRGGDGELEVSSGGKVITPGVIIAGERTGSTGTVTVTGSGSLLRTLGALTVGGSGQGIMTISSSGTVESRADSFVGLGTAPADIVVNSTGTLNIGTATARRDLTIGNAGAAPGTHCVYVAGGGTLNADDISIPKSGVLAGAGTINGKVAASDKGRVKPGGCSSEVGTLDINGDFDLRGDGSLLVDVGGTSSFDVADVSSTAYLGGTLVVNLVNSFSPSLNDTFRIATMGTRVGKFSAIDVSGASLSAGQGWEVIYNNTSVDIKVVTVVADVQIDAFYTDGTNLFVDYTIPLNAGSTSNPFSIGIVQSPDASATTVLLASLAITDAGDRGIGAHTGLMFASPSIATSMDDYLMAVVDVGQEIAETDEGNNNELFAGGSFVDSNGTTVHVQGTTGTDTVSVALSSSNWAITTNSVTHNYATSATTIINVHTHAAVDSVDASASNEVDYLYGGAGNDTLIAGTGGAYLYGGANNDTLIGGSGADRAYGEDGNDFLYMYAGTDTLEGGDGNDVLYGGDANDVLTGGEGNDYLYGGNANDLLQGGAGDDRLDGEANNDTLQGGDGNDVLYGGDDNDAMYGEEGDDAGYGGYGSDGLYGGAGSDTLNGEQDADYLAGDAGGDYLYGDYGSDVMYGGADNDVMYGGYDNDSMYGEDGDDTAYGSYGTDTMYGGNGIDRLYGESNSDYLDGGANNDILYGGDDIDYLHGQDGDDLLNGDAGMITAMAKAATTRSMAATMATICMAATARTPSTAAMARTSCTAMPPTTISMAATTAMRSMAGPATI